MPFFLHVTTYTLMLICLMYAKFAVNDTNSLSIHFSLLERLRKHRVKRKLITRDDYNYDEVENQQNVKKNVRDECKRCKECEEQWVTNTKMQRFQIIVISKFLKRYLKARRGAPAYSRAQ
jgi:hypothetical protein